MNSFIVTDGKGFSREGLNFGPKVSYAATAEMSMIHAYRTPIFAMLMAPAHGHEEIRLWEIQGEPEQNTAIGSLYKKFQVVRERQAPKITIEERMKFTIACASWAERIGQILVDQVERFKMGLDNLLLGWSQRYGFPLLEEGNEEKTVIQTQIVPKLDELNTPTLTCFGWTPSQLAAMEAKIELQTTLCAQGAQEQAKLDCLIKKINWTLGNAVTSLGNCLPRDVEKWTAKTLQTVIELPVLAPEIADILDVYVEKNISQKKQKEKDRSSCKKSSSSRLLSRSSDAVGSGMKLSSLRPVNQATARD
jgi:hypothetical protein